MYDMNILPEIPDSSRSNYGITNLSLPDTVIKQICNMPWTAISCEDLLCIAHAYYYFSIQFRENLEIACELYPYDENLKALYAEECHTDNLSPWPGVAEPGERLNHDDFMQRALLLQPADRTDHLQRAGASYLEIVRRVDKSTRARSIASYEDSGLSSVFLAILRAPCWDGAALQAFRFFLEQHILFDSATDSGHGALCRHLSPDASILPLWVAFRDMLTSAAPRLAETCFKHGRAKSEPSGVDRLACRHRTPELP